MAIRRCSIHNNDMGIMSNGDGSLAMAVDQRIEECRIYRNGDPSEPGHSHNLYLGGTSATLRFCEIHHSLTGHNVKSRAHHTRVEYCYVHHSANREFDLVDAAETARPQSDAVLLGNIIVKDPKCSGNQTVIHFGQDGGKQHDGTLYLAFNTVVTPFISPVVELSAAGAKARLWAMLSPAVLARRAKKWPASAAALRCRISAAGRTGSAAIFPLPRPAWTPAATISSRPAIVFRAARRQLSFAAPDRPRMTVAATAQLFELPSVPGLPGTAVLRPLDWQYHHPAGSERRPAEENVTAGAYPPAGRR